MGAQRPPSPSEWEEFRATGKMPPPTAGAASKGSSNRVIPAGWRRRHTTTPSRSLAKGVGPLFPGWDTAAAGGPMGCRPSARCADVPPRCARRSNPVDRAVVGGSNARRSGNDKAPGEAGALGSGGPGRIRTPDHLVRSQVLYPTELRALLRWGILAGGPHRVNQGSRYARPRTDGDGAERETARACGPRTAGPSAGCADVPPRAARRSNPVIQTFEGSNPGPFDSLTGRAERSACPVRKWRRERDSNPRRGF